MKTFLLTLFICATLGGCVAYVDPQPVPTRGVGDRDGDGVPNRADRDRDGDGVRNRNDARPNNPRRY